MAFGNYPQRHSRAPARACSVAPPVIDTVIASAAGLTAYGIATNVDKTAPAYQAFYVYVVLAASLVMPYAISAIHGYVGHSRCR